MMTQAGSKRCKMNIGEIIFTLPPISRRIARMIKSIWKKIINTEAAISFNNIWVNCFMCDTLIFNRVLSITFKTINSEYTNSVWNEKLFLLWWVSRVPTIEKVERQSFWSPRAVKLRSSISLLPCELSQGLYWKLEQSVRPL
jgi:hypothetical protein